MNPRFVTLTTLTSNAEAYALMAQLEAEGIESFIRDENIVTVQPFLSNAVGGVKVDVYEADSEKALLLLNQLKTERKREEAGLDIKWHRDFHHVDSYCPNCESFNVYRKKLKWYENVLAVIFFPVYLIVGFFSKKHFCADCGQVWKQ